MNLFLMRHAEAAPVGGSIRTDYDRTLTKQGEVDAALIGEAIARSNSQVALILTSPLRRAVDTGNIVQRKVGGVPSRVSENLVPGFHQKSLASELTRLGNAASVVAVGHQPDLSMFIAHLLADPQRATVPMSPGSVAHLVLHVNATLENARLVALLEPGKLRNASQ